ncbi:MAG: hypothetical protein AAGF94_01910 [Pseudomonadota bacterium]
MPMNGLGDLAQSYAMRSHNLSARLTIDALIDELSSGEAADIPQRLGGDFSGLASVESDLKGLDAYAIVIVEAGNFAASMQTALEAMQDTLGDTGAKLLTAVNPGDERLLDATVTEASQRFDALVNQLNARNGDRSLFAGNAVDQPALAPKEDILSALSTALAGLTSAADIRTAVDAWFDTPGGGFDTVAYMGGANPLAPFQISDSSVTTLDLRAQDDEIRAVLKEFSVAALMDEGLLSGNYDQRALLAEDVGLGMIRSERDLTSARARLGTEQANIETTEVRNATERTSLLLARDKLIGVDPFDVATQLEDAQAQLDILYAVTARLSRLSLAEYLR